jgi:hypothetical protein
MEENLENFLIEIEDIKLGKNKAEIEDSWKWDCVSFKWERICF